jgi:hypothetical protein
MNNNNISFQSIGSTQIYLNSANADIFLNKSNKSNVVFFFTNVLKIDQKSVEMKLSVVNAQIPVSWYLINDTNNKIYFSVNGVQNNYYFPNGNYNVNTFISTWISTFGNNWTLTFSKITNKITFSNSLGPIVFGNTISASNTLFSVMGFDSTKSYSSSVVTGQLISSYAVNFLGLSKINIKSTTFPFKNFDSLTATATSTLCSIPVSSNASGIINYNNLTDYKSIFKEYEFNSIDISITDDKNNYIDFNNIDWSMTLQIDITNEIVENLDNLQDIYFNQHQEF